MRTTILTCAFAVLLSFAPAVSEASLQIGSKVTFDTSLPGTYGGQFLLTDGGSDAGKEVSAFETFCVELTEFVANGGTYMVTGIGDITVQGGRTLTNYAAWLYTEFRQGTLNGFSSSSTNDANALQYAFWREMQYSDADINNALPGSPAAAYKALYDAESWLADYIADGSWNKAVGYLGAVRVINLQTIDGKHAQDQLVLVPEASTLAVWSVLCLAGLIAYRRQLG
ncbi:hypothetical protein [Bythopirellula goksoeyrii]|uniref:VPDSG-CTERM protein sorting domain-containing protein n=1 Tax=Bythopirellula goksoeyrii TaxID=1400387 RepID=A0A5B9QEF0_9BACT|nr:hypothetical protein [Bythopirellula goksoeyrii]QEG36010.1 hypothetical protein Pr1d_33190 [Bythopirellula goksoeyrii]